MSDGRDGLKRRLRSLKKLEYEIRFGRAANVSPGDRPRLVWDRFFSLDAGKNKGALYNIDLLAVMDRSALTIVIEEYLRAVCERAYGRAGVEPDFGEGAAAYEVLGLAEGADRETIRARYRELAKKYHPDVGGTDEAFIAIKAAVDNLLKR